MVVSLAYPIADIVLSGLLLGAWALSGWRIERVWMLLLTGMGINQQPLLDWVGSTARELLARFEATAKSAGIEIDASFCEPGDPATAIVERATLVVSAIENCRPAAVRESIREAIAEYEQKIRPQP